MISHKMLCEIGSGYTWINQEYGGISFRQRYGTLCKAPLNSDY